jgi:hypothetical protein
MKRGWASWEPWAAVGWQRPEVINSILACVARRFTRFTTRETSVGDFFDLADPAISVVVAAAELGSRYTVLSPVAVALHPPHPLSDEAFSAAEALFAKAMWILIARLAPHRWEDPQSDAHRWLPLDREGHTWMERLTGATAPAADAAASGAASAYPEASRRPSAGVFARDSLEWFAGSGTIDYLELREEWECILARAEDLMWERLGATIY